MSIHGHVNTDAFQGVHGSQEPGCDKCGSMIHIHVYIHTYIPTIIPRAEAIVMINVGLAQARPISDYGTNFTGAVCEISFV